MTMRADDHLCAVCGTQTVHFAVARVLKKYDAEFRRCPHCGLIVNPDPHWLGEAYGDTIYEGDEGLLRRCQIQSMVTGAVIRAEGIKSGRFLDWAGAYGTLTRMMRDKGFDYWTNDPYVTNVLAKGYDGDLSDGYDLITAFEVVEHLEDPIAALAEVAKFTGRLLISTHLQPQDAPPQPDDWWYYQLDSGQHIALHTQKSLSLLAESLGFSLTSDGDKYHLLHRAPVSRRTRLMLSSGLSQARRSTAGGVRKVLRKG
jgi:hypothetical protein